LHKQMEELKTIFGAINVEEMEKINKEFTEYDLKREEIIKQSRDVLKNSKKAIFATHRKDYVSANKLLLEAEEKAKKLLPIVQEIPSLRGGSFSNAMEEYAESKIFFEYITKQQIPTLSSLGFVDSTEYLGGLIDFTGEITRVAVLLATERNITKVKEIKKLIDDILSSLILFDFRNSGLRKKYDSVKWNLSKVEGLLYDLSLSDWMFRRKKIEGEKQGSSTGTHLNNEGNLDNQEEN